MRRGRRRYWKSDSDDDKQAAYQTLYELLTGLVRLLAPVMPFWTDDIYQNLVRRADPNAPTSVHLTDWPEADQSLRDELLESDMDAARSVIAAGRQARSEYNIKLRQPLGGANVSGIGGEQCERVETKLQQHMRDELNVDWVKCHRNAIWGDYFDIIAKLNFKPRWPETSPPFQGYRN